MPTAQEIDTLAREALYLMEKEHVPERMAKQSALNAHKDIRWTDGIFQEIGIRMSELRKEQRPKQKPKEQPSLLPRTFPTHIEKSFKDD